MPFKTTRTRLILIVTAVLVVAFLSTHLVSHRITQDIKRQSVLETELPLTGDNIYSGIQIDLVRPIFVSSLMANDTFLHDWVHEGELNPLQVQRYLDTIKDRYGVFTAFFISERTHLYYHFSGIAQKVSPEDPEDVWYFRASEMDEPYEINVDPNQAQNNIITVFINYRVTDEDGTFLGITGVGLELEAVAETVKRYQNDFGRSVYFVNSDGLITLHPDSSKSYREHLSDVEGLAPYAEEIIEKERGAYRIERQNETVLMTTRYIPELDWTLIVEAKESDVLPGPSNGLVTTVLIALAAIFVTAIAIAFVINRYQRRLEAMATVDSLTGLANRQVFDAMLQQAVRRSRRSKQPVSLVIFDIDRFKTVNDEFGHLAGDEVLKRLAGLARDAVRSSDILARWGGEEFALLMENCPKEKAVQIAEALRAEIEEANLLDGLSNEEKSRPLTASAGVATISGEDEKPAVETIQHLVSNADQALYAAKSSGRNAVRTAE